MPSLPRTGEYRSGHRLGRARHTPPPSATAHIGSSKSQSSSLPHCEPTKPPHGDPLPIFVSSPPHAASTTTAAIASLIATRIPETRYLRGVRRLFALGLCRSVPGPPL